MPATRLKREALQELMAQLAAEREQLVIVLQRANVVDSPEEAEEVAQEAFVRAVVWLARRDAAPVIQSPLGLLLRIAVRYCHGRRARERRVVAVPAEGDIDGIPDGSVSVERQVLDSDFEDRLSRAILKLPTHLRRVVELVGLEGLTNTEAAERLQIPEDTVRTRLHAARRRLRFLLARESGRSSRES